ncbi:MAG TPA: hypothetical protein EYP36_00430 [Calditrichaeota bacterium]|nr:hypothetical protein [Calditrichota bacterium]
MMITTFDAVDLSGYSSSYISLAYFVQDTGWETSDSIRIWVEVDGGVVIDLHNTNGFDIWAKKLNRCIPIASIGAAFSCNGMAGMMPYRHAFRCLFRCFTK